jgi:hypothetical protein
MTPMTDQKRSSELVNASPQPPQRSTTDEQAPDPFLYEWVVREASDSGISRTPHGAMDALAGSLEAHGNGTGFVRPVVLRHDGEDWGYRRYPVSHQAACEDGALSWL